MTKTRLRLGDADEVVHLVLVLLCLIIGLGWLLWPGNIITHPERLSQERRLIEDALLELSHNLRLYVDANQGAMPESIDAVLDSDYGVGLEWLPRSPGALRYHRAADSYEAVPPAALLVSIPHRSGLLSVTYGGELVQQPVDRRGKILARPQ